MKSRCAAFHDSRLCVAKELMLHLSVTVRMTASKQIIITEIRLELRLLLLHDCPGVQYQVNNELEENRGIWNHASPHPDPLFSSPSLSLPLSLLFPLERFITPPSGHFASHHVPSLSPSLPLSYPRHPFRMHSLENQTDHRSPPPSLLIQCF